MESKNNSVSPINQLLCALRFYATGCYQMTAADLCGFSTSTAHRIVHRVSAAIASLRPQHIYFPELPNEIQQTQVEFYKRARFPYVIGAIDCTHVKFIKSPGGESPEIFRNRKHYFSLNIQAICNAKLEFTDIVARWPGSTHDSYIFNNCYRRAMFEQGQYGNAVLVGDAGYACNRYMMTPLEQCNNDPENLYNESQIRTRNCIERLFGVWKKRFPAMAVGLGVTVEHSFPIIIATAILHNIARRSGESMPPNDNQIINSASWDALLALGNINNGNVDVQRAHRTNPNYRRRSEIVTNYFARYLLIFAAGLCAVSAYSGSDLPPGPYCVDMYNQPECCDGRQDRCSHPILDTLCYCDVFCNRTNGHDDCCPDYFEKCHGAPPQIVDASCIFRGVTYFPGDQAEQNCNTCTCIIDQYTNKTRWQCSDDQCIISSDVLNGVRDWLPENYTQFQGKKLKDGLLYKLGTFPLSPATQHMGAIRYDKEVYEREFDSRKTWPNYISPVIDQGWCGSDWAVAVAAVASDRFAIQSNGAESQVLSPQSILSCNEKGQRGCDGGHIDIAWNHARNFGLVSELCFPYKATLTSCPFTMTSHLQEDCGHPDRQRKSRYRMGPAGRLVKEKDIMHDIKESGPVFAIMTVYQDFFHYRRGIYRHTQHGDNQQQGLHSVRIVGWGEEFGQKFWIVANSWGTEWGEHGYFRIARGSNESGIESFVVTSTPEVISSAWKRK